VKRTRFHDDFNMIAMIGTTRCVGWQNFEKSFFLFRDAGL